MKFSNAPIIAAVIAVAGAVVIAQAPKPAAGAMHAHAVIKGEGISGTPTSPSAAWERERSSTLRSPFQD